MRNVNQLIKNLESAEKAVEAARAQIIDEIRERMDLGNVTAYEFSAASGINKGNLYNLLKNGRWNSAVAFAALDLLSTPIKDTEF